MERVVFWKGRQIDEMDREELIEALKFAAARVEECNTPEAIEAYALGRTAQLFGSRGAKR